MHGTILHASPPGLNFFSGRAPAVLPTASVVWSFVSHPFLHALLTWVAQFTTYSMPAAPLSYAVPAVVTARQKFAPEVTILDWNHCFCIFHFMLRELC
jgi:hypothetical protein